MRRSLSVLLSGIMFYARDLGVVNAQRLFVNILFSLEAIYLSIT